jgi:preprotein translocase subunit SecA
MLEGLKEESVGFLFNVTVEAAPAPAAAQVAPVAPPQGLAEFAAAAAKSGGAGQPAGAEGGVATKERTASPTALRAKGIDDSAPPLTYTGPSEDGTAEVQRSGGGPRHAAPGGGTRRERREAARKQSKRAPRRG